MGEENLDLRTNPVTKRIDDIRYQIEQGELKIPQFQRNFVWNLKQTAQLLDSIVKGYPIGAFTYWKTKDRLRSVKKFGGLSLKDSPPNDYVNYVLDGQQRITSIYACLKGETINDTDYSKIYINLHASNEENIVITDVNGLSSNEYISINDLLSLGIVPLANRYGSNNESMKKIDIYKNRLNNYSFSIIELQDAPLDIATEIFTRINTSGKSLSVFEIMCAKTYDEEKNFDLYEERKKQLEKWENVNFETVPHQTVLQAISICIQKNCRRRDILNLDKNTFIDKWVAVDKAFCEAIDYFRNMYGIAVSKLLPYDALLVPFVYYFYKKKEKPVGKAAAMLQDYFWRCVLSKHFTEGVEGKLAADCNNVIDPILNDKSPEEKSLPSVEITVSSIIENGGFSLSSAYVKGLLCILASQHPKSFNDGAEVVIDNAWLSQSNSKNFHHFFPKAYMKKNCPLIPEDKVNHIANITIVDGNLNKNKIKDRPPSDYMGEFKMHNTNLQDTMSTHLINDIEKYGIWKDDYNSFFNCRIKAIKDQLLSKIIKITNDRVDDIVS